MSEKNLPPQIGFMWPKAQILSPKLEKGPDGNWQISEPEKIKWMLGMDHEVPVKK